MHFVEVVLRSLGRYEIISPSGLTGFTTEKGYIYIKCLRLLLVDLSNVWNCFILCSWANKNLSFIILTACTFIHYVQFEGFRNAGIIRLNILINSIYHFVCFFAETFGPSLLVHHSLADSIVHPRAWGFSLSISISTSFSVSIPFWFRSSLIQKSENQCSVGLLSRIRSHISESELIWRTVHSKMACEKE